MKFYFSDNIVTTSEVELDGLAELTEAQIDFYLANRNATKAEIQALALTPVPEISLSDAKLAKIAELELAFQNETNVTGTIDTGLGFTVKGCYFDLINVMTIQKALELDNNSEQFIFDINNTPHVLTLENINAIFNKFVERGKELYIKLETLKATVNNKLKVSTVQAVTW